MRAANASDIAVTEHDDGSISMSEPIVGISAKVTIRPRIEQPDAYSWEAMNSPGNPARSGTRAPAIFNQGSARPRKLGHVLYTSPDFEASIRFLTDVLGFKISDTSAGMIVFLRCSTDHHNVGLINAPVPFFHHSSWQVNDLDEIGQGAQALLAVDPTRDVWGLGRHFLGSNLFWYFRDPAGNFAEYYADLDQIPEDAEWDARDWAPDKSLYAWGPPVPRKHSSSRRCRGDRRSTTRTTRSLMKIARFTEGGRTRLGIVATDTDEIIDVGARRRLAADRRRRLCWPPVHWPT